MADYKFMDSFFKGRGSLKSIYITEIGIIGSDEDKDSFLDKMNSGEKGELGINVWFELVQVIKFIIIEESNGIHFFYRVSDKEEKAYLEFEKSADFECVLELLRRKCKQLQPTTEYCMKKGSNNNIRRTIYRI